MGDVRSLGQSGCRIDYSMEEEAYPDPFHLHMLCPPSPSRSSVVSEFSLRELRCTGLGDVFP